jgi:uncharacterized membrane protein
MRSPRYESICWATASLLSLAGLGLSTYLAVLYVSGGAPVCGAIAGCAEVTTSEYAVFAGVPVAVLAVAMYATLLLGSLAVLGLDAPPAQLRGALPILAAGGVGFSAYLTWVELFVLHAICVYCLGSAALVTAVFALLVAATVLRRAGETDGPFRVDGGVRPAQANQSVEWPGKG